MKWMLLVVSFVFNAPFVPMPQLTVSEVSTEAQCLAVRDKMRLILKEYTTQAAYCISPEGEIK